MAANPIDNDRVFAQLAIRHWQQLGEELQADVDQFNSGGGKASFSRASGTEYRVSNSDSGLEVRIVADPADRIARYDFVRTNNHSAGAPEGGIFSMRVGDSGGVEFYSSDQPVTAEEARRVLLEPVLK
jgi:hypothetical protein